MNMINKTKKKPGKKVKILFWLVIALSVITAGFMFTNFSYSGYIKNVFLGITALAGLLLIIFSSIEKLDKLFMSFLILTGASALGLFGGFFIGLLYYISRFFGDFYNAMLMLCPFGLIAGLIGCIVLFVKRRKIPE
jgi:hypothetical protein